jgi:hypothetical protein
MTPHTANGSPEPRDRPDEATGIVLELAKYLYETEERLEPGTHDVEWEGLDGYTRSFLVERVWALLTRRSLLARYFELADRNLVDGRSVPTE